MVENVGIYPYTLILWVLSQFVVFCHHCATYSFIYKHSRIIYVLANFTTADLNTVDSRYLDFGYLEQPLISKKKSGPCLNIEI